MSRMSVEEAERRLQSAHNERWREHRNVPDPPEFFHYCSAQGLKGILKDRFFRASDILSLTDYSEVVHGREMACELLRESSTPLAECLLEPLQQVVGLGKKWFVHVVCLCASRDVLSQWRGYSGVGGFAIGLDPEKLEQRVKQLHFGVLRMLYDRGQQRKILKESIENFEAVFSEFGPNSTIDASYY